MHEEKNTHDEWQPCPPGELNRMVGRLDARERRARFRQLTSTGLMSMLLFAAGAILVGGFAIYEEPMYGGVSCTDCLSHADEYYSHLVGKGPMADLELVAKIETHLEMCLCCRAKFHQAYPDVPLKQLAEVNLRFRPLLPTFAVALCSGRLLASLLFAEGSFLVSRSFALCGVHRLFPPSSSK